MNQATTRPGAENRHRHWIGLGVCAGCGRARTDLALKDGAALCLDCRAARARVVTCPAPVAARGHDRPTEGGR